MIDLSSASEVPSALDRAITSLERARRLAPVRVDLLNDLAVTYLEVAAQRQLLTPALTALDLVERALAQDSTFLPALFNQALILERLYLLDGAHSAWRRYLASEQDADWRKEGQVHELSTANDLQSASDSVFTSSVAISSLPTTAAVAAATRRSPQRAREYSFQLLGAWGRAINQSDSAAARRALDVARAIAGTLDAQDGDGTVALSIETIDRWSRDPGAQRRLGLAHARLAEGIALYSSAAYDDAAHRLSEAEQSFRELEAPSARWAAFYRAVSETNRGAFERSERGLSTVLRQASPREPSLAGKATWALGVIEVRRGNFERANVMYRAAVPFVERSHESENRGAISYVLSEGLILAGQSTAGRTEALFGLRRLSPFRSSYFLVNHLTTVASLAHSDGLNLASLAIVDEIVDVAKRRGVPDVVAWALCERATNRQEVGRSAEAQADVNEAGRWASRIVPGSGRDRVRADVDFAAARLVRAANPRTALELLDRAIPTYRRQSINVALPAALYETAIAERDLGNLDGARRRLQQAIVQIETQRASFETAAGRVALYETVESVFDEMIRTELASGHAASAFEYLERSRIAVWEQSGGGPVAVGERARQTLLARIGTLLPADMLFIEYAVLHDQLVIWTVSRSGWRHHVVRVSRDSIANLANHSMSESADVTASGQVASAALFDLLLQPLQRELNGIHRLAIVPDRELGRVPFVALMDRTSGRYAIEDYEVRILPNAEFLLAASRQMVHASPHSAALIVGNPAIDTSAVPRLSNLPGAATEAQRIAQLYRRPELLVGARAGRKAILDALPTAEVFHFAGHAVFNIDQPELSFLAMAPSTEGGDGILRAREIGNLRLSNLRVLILSACSSLSPRPSRSGAVAGLAYSFLRAGVPATISTLWEVSDAATVDMLIEFHRELVKGMPPAQALRAAQIWALKDSSSSGRRSTAWAAFIYTGP